MNKATIVCILFYVIATTTTQVESAGTPKWGEWSQWTKCSVTCGNGVKERIAYRIDSQGHMTNQSLLENGLCFDQQYCPVDGGWTFWYPWSVCSKMCGVGTQFRRRECKNPEPRSGGKPCVGLSQESQDCNKDPCPTIPPGFDVRICAEESMFMCESKIYCVNKTFTCDKTLNCNDGSDEKSCKIVYINGSHDIFYMGSKWCVLITILNVLMYFKLRR